MGAFIIQKANSPEVESFYIFIHVFVGGVSYAGITPNLQLICKHMFDKMKKEKLDKLDFKIAKEDLAFGEDHRNDCQMP